MQIKLRWDLRYEDNGRITVHEVQFRPMVDFTNHKEIEKEYLKDFKILEGMEFKNQKEGDDYLMQWFKGWISKFCKAGIPEPMSYEEMRVAEPVYEKVKTMGKILVQRGKHTLYPLMGEWHYAYKSIRGEASLIEMVMGGAVAGGQPWELMCSKLDDNMTFRTRDDAEKCIEELIG